MKDLTEKQCHLIWLALVDLDKNLLNQLVGKGMTKQQAQNERVALRQYFHLQYLKQRFGMERDLDGHRVTSKVGTFNIAPYKNNWWTVYRITENGLKRAEEFEGQTIHVVLSKIWREEELQESRQHQTENYS